MRRFPASALVAALLAACAGGRGPEPSEGGILEHQTPPGAALPDDFDRAASRIAALALADRPDVAAGLLQELTAQDDARAARGEERTGLADNALEVVTAMSGPRAYTRFAQDRVDERTIDEALHRRLETHLEQEPLAVAARRLRQDNQLKVALVFNRIVAPLSRFVAGGTLNPIESGRAALASLLVMHSVPEVTTQERQALHAYREYLRREPEGREAPWVREQVDHYAAKVLRQRHTEALEVAERGLEAGHPRVALAHLDRAERVLPGDPRAAELHARAEYALVQHERDVARSNHARTVLGVPLYHTHRDDLERLLRLTLDGSVEQAADLASRWRAEGKPWALDDELEWIQNVRLAERGEEDEFFEAMQRSALRPVERSNMARHATRLLGDPTQNPYAFFRHAVRQDRRERIGWVLLGRHRFGPTQRDLPRPLEWVLDVPAFASTILTLPLRIAQYPTVRARFGGSVLAMGGEYVQRFPTGRHAEEVHRALEDLYTQRGQWSSALEHHQARAEPRPKTLARYRERIAERTLDAAELQRRPDVQVQIYRSVIAEYPDTPAAERARAEFRKMFEEATPQHIRISRGFLEENPAVWAGDALGLRPALMDGDGDNGEVAEEGVTLLGQTLVRIELEDQEPVVERVPRENFARFVAALEEASYRQLSTDKREVAVADPQRDLFLERARLDALDTPDARPSAASEAVFLGRREKHGVIRRRDSPLPVEVVLQGGLEDFGFSAFPRLKLPEGSRDAFLYE